MIGRDGSLMKRLAWNGKLMSQSEPHLFQTLGGPQRPEMCLPSPSAELRRRLGQTLIAQESITSGMCEKYLNPLVHEVKRIMFTRRIAYLHFINDGTCLSNHMKKKSLLHINHGLFP